MKVIEQDPPENLRERCGAAFDLSHSEPCWTYGDVVYNPYGNRLDPFVMAHESVHAAQQGMDPSGWWERYLLEPEFRQRQEMEAYRVQYAFAKEAVKDRNQVARMLHAYAADLSGGMYGKGLTHARAVELIRNPR